MQPRTLVAATAAIVVYVGMWAGYLQGWTWLHTIDDRMLRTFYEFGLDRPRWVSAWDWFCIIFSPAAFRIVTVLLIAWLMIRRRVNAALFLLASVELSSIVTAVAKSAADRPRPSTALVYAPSSSFPSGHALGVMVCVLALLTVFAPMVSEQWRALLAVLGAVLVVAIGVGRVVLNVHHPSDVLAGWALGFLYYLLCLPLLTVRVGRPVAPDTSC